MNSYSDMVRRLSKPSADIEAQMQPHHYHLMHMLIGLSGEVGELTDAFKKHIFYDKPLDLPNVLEELGDIEFYLQGIRNTYGISRDLLIHNNHEKLSKRYSLGKYSNEQAQARADKLGDSHE